MEYKEIYNDLRKTLDYLQSQNYEMRFIKEDLVSIISEFFRIYQKLENMEKKLAKIEIKLNKKGLSNQKGTQPKYLIVQLKNTV